MPGFGFGFGSHKNNLRLVGVSHGNSVPSLSPAQRWTGSQGSGFNTTPVDPARVTAKPVLRLIVPPNQYFSDELLVGVMAGANDGGSLLKDMGLKKVEIHCEGTSRTIGAPSFQSFADANGTYRTYFGWWARLQHDGRNGHANVYFEAFPRDTSMQSRVIGPYQFSPQQRVHDATLTVAASGAGDFTSIADALAACQDHGFQNPLVTITEPGDYDIADGGLAYEGAGYCTIAASDPGVRIAKPGYAGDAAGALRSRYAGLRFQGANLTIDMQHITEIYSEASASRAHWLDGCTVTNAGGPGTLWRGVTRPAPWTVRDGAWFTECTAENCNDAFAQAKLVRGTTNINGTGDLYRDCPMVIGCASTGHRSDLTLGHELPAISVRYVGMAATASIEMAGGNSAATRTVTIKIAGDPDRTFTLEKSEAAYEAGTNYTVQDLAAWLNAIPGIAATLLDQTSGRAAAWISLAGADGGAFSAQDIKTSSLTLVTTIGGAASWWKATGSVDNVIIWGNVAVGSVGEAFDLSGTGAKRDVLIANNAIQNDKAARAGAGLRSRFDGAHSHVVIAHNTLSTQGIILETNSSYASSSDDLLANNSVLAIAWGGSAASTAIVNNHFHAGQNAPDSAAGQANVMGTSIGGDETSLYADDRQGDFEARGDLLVNIAPSVLRFSAISSSIASIDVKGASASLPAPASVPIPAPPSLAIPTIDGIDITNAPAIDGKQLLPQLVVAPDSGPIVDVDWRWHDRADTTLASSTLPRNEVLPFTLDLAATGLHDGDPLYVSATAQGPGGASALVVASTTVVHSPPQISTVTANATQVSVLTDDYLDPAAVPDASLFIVVASSYTNPISPTAVTILQAPAPAGLRLAIPTIFSTDTITISGDFAGLSAPRDLNGEPLASFSRTAVNNTAASPPEALGARIDANPLEITFDDDLDQANPPKADDFEVQVMGVVVAVAAIAFSGPKKLAITLVDPASSTGIYTVQYFATSSALRNTVGEDAAPFIVDVTNTTAASPPVSQAATINGDTLEITFDDDLDQASEPPATDFVVENGGQVVPVSSIAFSGSKKLALTLAVPGRSTGTYTVQYLATTSALRNTAGEHVEAFALSVTNTTPAAPPIFSSGDVDGQAVRVTFSQPLLASGVPDAADLVIRANGSTIAVIPDSPAISGSTLAFTLAVSAGYQAATDWRYTPNASAAKRLKNAFGEEVAAVQTAVSLANITAAPAPTPTPTPTATSVSQHGVTWTFDKAYPVAQYANGDWAVQGPVRITSITPASQVVNGTYSGASSYSNRTINGTEVNPGNRSFTNNSTSSNKDNQRQGWDSLYDLNAGSSTTLLYDYSKNVDPGVKGPLDVTTGSVVKVVSLTSPNVYVRPALKDMAVLTVTDALPKAGDLRPGVSSADKASPFNENDFDLSVFKSYPRPASAPTFSQALSKVQRMIEATRPDTVNSRNIHATGNQQEYGREIANDIHSALLCLHLDFTAAEKMQLLRGLAAIAFDLWSRAVEGGVTPPWSGSNQWKKSTMCIVAAALHSSSNTAALNSLRSVCDYTKTGPIFSEDGQLIKIDEPYIAVPRSLANSRPRDAYARWMKGAFDFAEEAQDVGLAGANWSTAYRTLWGNTIIGGLLAVHLTTGARLLWNREDVFTYMFGTNWAYEGSTIGADNNAIPRFAGDMLTAYRPADATPPTVAEASVFCDAGLGVTTLWLRFDKSLDEGNGVPPASAFTVQVNGTSVPFTVESYQQAIPFTSWSPSSSRTGVWRTNVGLQLSNPVISTDVVTVSYSSPSSNALRSAVDKVNVAAFTNRACINETPSVGGQNSSYPVVRFTSANPDRYTVAGGTGLGADGPYGTLWIPSIKIFSTPSSMVEIFGAAAGTPCVEVQLMTDRRIKLALRDASGSLFCQEFCAPLALNTEYSLRFDWDASISSVNSGFNAYLNGNQARSTGGGAWAGSSGRVCGYSRVPVNPYSLGKTDQAAFNGELGGFWLYTQERITDAARVAKFTSTTNGSLDIGTLGDGITGTQPVIFFVGNAAQYNDPAGINRGSGPGFFRSNGGVVDVSGNRWT